MDAAAVHWHFSLYPLPLTDDFTREEEESNTGEHGDGSRGVHGGNHEMWRSRMKRREAVMRGAGRKVENKECELERDF